MNFSISDNSNDDISRTGRPIDFVSDSSAGFSGTVDRMEQLSFASNARWRPAAILKISNDNFSGTTNKTA